jgi:protein-tyrosine phosphatase
MTVPARPAQPPRLVLDSGPERQQPKLFRTSAQLAARHGGDVRGLAELRISGSASFSKNELTQMRESFEGPAIVVDLRQESHALVNGLPVTWYGPSDWDNVGRSNREVERRERELLQAMPELVQLSPVKEDDEGFQQPVQLQVRSLQTEEELAEELGLGYFRLFVTDHLRPSDREVDRFLTFVDHLAPGTWLHFHCRGGKGRTTTFMVLYDMLRNAGQVSFDEIVARQQALPPNYALLNVRPQSPRHVYYQQRADFVREFYTFSQQREAGQSWSQWLAGRP